VVDFGVPVFVGPLKMPESLWGPMRNTIVLLPRSAGSVVEVFWWKRIPRRKFARMVTE
jgi:hypothetical protein